MKNIFILLALSLLAAGCSDDSTDNEEPQHPVGQIELSSESATGIGYAGDVVEVTVTSNAAWRLAGEKDWSHPSVTEGKSGDKVTFTIDPNPVDKQREQEYKFFCGDKTVVFTIVQQANEVFSFLTPAEYPMEASGGDFRVQVVTNMKYDVRIEDSEWISEKYASEEGTGDIYYYTYTAGANNTYAPRTGRVVYTAGGVDYPIVIGQVQNDALQLADGQPEHYDFENPDAQSIDIMIRTNVEISVNPGANWIHYVSDGPISVQGFDTHKLHFEIDPADRTRDASIQISSVTNPSLFVSVTVKQTNDQAAVVEIPDEHFRAVLKERRYITVLDGSKVELTPEGLAATSIDVQWRPVKSLEGIEHFINLEKLKFENGAINCIDISSLKKVSSLTIINNPIENLHLGDNSIESMSIQGLFDGATGMKTPAQKLVVSGTHLKSLDMNEVNSWLGKDDLQTLDVSGCPALEKLKCKYSTLTTLYIAPEHEALIGTWDLNPVTKIEVKK